MFLRCFRISVWLLLALAFASGGGPLLAGQIEAIDVGARKQLFIDDHLIASKRNVELTMNPPHQISDVLVEADAPWEKAANAYVWGVCTIRKENGKFRLWYDVLPHKRAAVAENSGNKSETSAADEKDVEDAGQSRHAGYVVDGSIPQWVAYAESDDGVHFQKPVLRLHPLRGSKENNVIIPNCRGASVWIDPVAPPEDRYRTQTKGAGKLTFHSSPDGIHWQKTHALDVGSCDTQSIVWWEPDLQRYLLYTRRWFKFTNKNHCYRIHRRLLSTNLLDWTDEVPVLAADETDMQTYESPTGQPPVDYYGATVFRYPDEHGPYIMLAHAFWHWYDQGLMDAQKPQFHLLGPQTFDIRLCGGRDGVNFERLGGRKAFMRPGSDGSFYSRMIWAIPNPIPMGDELWIYFWGTNRDHAYHVDPAVADEPLRAGIGRAVMRLDGFVSADAPYEGGELATKPLKFTGKTLELNLDTAAGGSVKVELLDEQGRPIDGFTEKDASTLCGNSVRMKVSWGENHDVGKLAGRPVILRFIMRDCKLYAFRFKL